MPKIIFTYLCRKSPMLLAPTTESDCKQKKIKIKKFSLFKFSTCVDKSFFRIAIKYKPRTIKESISVLKITLEPPK